MNPPSDHKADAQRLLPPSESIPTLDLELGLRAAQVHASLAIAEQLERLNKQLASVLGVSPKAAFGSDTRYVRTGR